MTPGIYHVKFSSSIQAHGEGMAVINNGTVNGGDVGYVYTGNFIEESGGVSSTLRIKKWNQNITSVFGPYPEFTLNLKGSLSPDQKTFQVSGSSPQIQGATINIHGFRVSDTV
ncbi:MAG: hypothetical protein MI748_07485 [Opitutales bacterium]|nr:hypothetical protein [Opitutales bacterium]